MNNNIPFKTANILLPKKDFEKWSVIACDQFTSDKAYWDDTKKHVGDYRSTLKITLPEIYLEGENTEETIKNINAEMKKYLTEDVFTEYKDAMIYVERTQADGRIRPGIIGAVDLEDYDYRKGSEKLIRATEGTVLERIPPRVKIRKDAPLELPHIALLIDDINKTVIEPLSAKKSSMTKLYDFDLMMGGGHIEGYLIDQEEIGRITNALANLCNNEEHPLLFAVGDGNHSLATAKECYEMIKKDDPEAAQNSPARYALAEVGNIHCTALDFEPIYRVVFGVDSDDFINEFKKHFETKTPNTTIIYTHENKEGTVEIDVPEDKLTTGVIQAYIDSYLTKNPTVKVDYIHGTNDVKALSSAPNTVGLIYEGISKDTLFSSVKATGSLPRKTFSMGEARDKRYYLECRKIK
ncbi:MAG: DUF1015 domain-containing protein [Clostridia bacterium]|nr:DUF1015 domain-containing protein [Clostridia bacterium]